jgi:hypothetical protein
MRNRENRASRRRNGSWRNRDTNIALGRLAVAVAAILMIAGVGIAHQPVYGPPKAPHGTYQYDKATEVERLTHDLKQAFDMDKVSPTASPNPGWGAD